MKEAELRDDSLVIAGKLDEYCQTRGIALSHFSLAWILANPIMTSVVLGPRTMEQFDDNLVCLNVTVTPEDEAFVDSLNPPGEHSGKGFQDPAYPVLGRPRG